MYLEEDYLPLSNIKEFSVCPRRWALQAIEGLERDNVYTIGGTQIHERVHNGLSVEKKQGLVLFRGLYVSSAVFGVSGQCDMVEFLPDEKGISLKGLNGKWVPFPVEYKHGRAMEEDGDRLQLCCQAMCLEETFCCKVPEGALFYGKMKRREVVLFTNELREKVKITLVRMHDLFKKGCTPVVKRRRFCKGCAFYGYCLFTIFSIRPVSEYVKEKLKE